MTTEEQEKIIYEEENEIGEEEAKKILEEAFRLSLMKRMGKVEAELQEDSEEEDEEDDEPKSISMIFKFCYKDFFFFWKLNQSINQ